MKSRIKISLASIFLTLCLVGQASADWSFHLTTDYEAGDTQAVFNLKLSTNEILKIVSYAFEFGYDNTELSYVSYENTPISGLTFDMLGFFSNDQETGTLNGFNAASFSPPTALPGDYQLGSFTFDVVNAVTDGASDFYFDYQDPMFGFEINMTQFFGDDTKAIPSSTDIRPATVPVPSAFWLMGTGLLGLAGIRRKKA